MPPPTGVGGGGMLSRSTDCRRSTPPLIPPPPPPPPGAAVAAAAVVGPTGDFDPVEGRCSITFRWAADTRVSVSSGWVSPTSASCSSRLLRACSGCGVAWSVRGLTIEVASEGGFRGEFWVVGECCPPTNRRTIHGKQHDLRAGLRFREATGGAANFAREDHLLVEAQ